MRPLALSLALCLLCLGAFADSARGHWIEDGVSLGATAGSTCRVVPDGLGGAILVWVDSRSGNYGIYAQRLNVSGTPLWPAGGVALCSQTAYLAEVVACADGAGGAVAVWSDYRNGNKDVYAQRVGPTGSVRWTVNGVAVCTSASDQNYPQVVSDGAGGAIVAWEDWRAGNLDAYAQHIDAGGTYWWTYNGVAVCAETANQTWVRACADGAGGAVLTWMDARNGNYDVYAQRVGPLGTKLWTATGVPICTNPMTQGNPDLVADGTGGTFIAWQDQRSGNSDIYAQRVDGTGAVQWTADGTGVCTAAGSQGYVYLDRDGAGGVVLCWFDGRSSPDQIYAHRFSGSGTPVWTADGVALSALPYQQTNPRIVSDGAGGAVVAWEDVGNIRVRRIDAAGNPQWAVNGVLACGMAGTQQGPRLVADAAGGAIVSWDDNRTGGWSPYAGHVESSGELYAPAPLIASVADIPADQGGLVRLGWLPSPDESGHGDWVTEYTIWRAIEPAAAVAKIARDGTALLTAADGLPAELPPGTLRLEKSTQATWYWELVDTRPLYYQPAYGLPVATHCDSTASGHGWHYFQVVAQTADPMVYWASAPDSGYSVDNLAPCPPTALAGTQSYVPPGLALQWDANREPDLACYRVYRGAAADFVPVAGNLLCAPCDTSVFDDGASWTDGWWYKVAAVDVHGNQSGFAVLGPAQVTGLEPPPLPEAAFLAQNAPNPFNPRTVIPYGLARAGHARLGIYDASGRLVRVLQDGALPAGRYEAAWDGRDGRGRAVPSGLYLCRLLTGEGEQTRKMVLVR